MVLQRVDFAGQLLNAIKRHDADLGIFQRHGVTGVVVIDDAVQSDHFAGHLEAGHLIAPVFGRDTGFEKSGADGVERSEFVAIVNSAVPRLILRRMATTSSIRSSSSWVQPHGHAQLPQIAVGQATLMACEIHT